jgi:hypothetical protein
VQYEEKHQNSGVGSGNSGLGFLLQQFWLELFLGVFRFRASKFNPFLANQFGQCLQRRRLKQ